MKSAIDTKRFEKLKARMVKHFDNEMKLIKEFRELKPQMSTEQLQELLVAMATHPHALQAEKLIDKNDLTNIFEELKRIREEDEERRLNNG